MEKMEKKVKIGEYYQTLGRSEKGRFTTWLQMVTTYSQSTVMSRLKDDGWRPLERKAIEDGIRSGEWRG
jgi:hypothetical protein